MLVCDLLMLECTDSTETEEDEEAVTARLAVLEGMLKWSE